LGVEAQTLTAALPKFYNERDNLDPGFSEHSYGFRPGRSAHQAVETAHQYIEAGYTWVVDLDIEQFFNRVNPLCPSPSGCSNAVWLSPWVASAMPWMALSTFTRTPRWLKGFYSRMGWPRALGYSSPRRSFGEEPKPRRAQRIADP
jgi:hypothetical protein